MGDDGLYTLYGLIDFFVSFDCDDLFAGSFSEDLFRDTGLETLEEMLALLLLRK